MKQPIVIEAAGNVYQVTVHLDPKNGYAAIAEDLETGEIITDGMGMHYPIESEALLQMRKVLKKLASQN